MVQIYFIRQNEGGNGALGISSLGLTKKKFFKSQKRVGGTQKKRWK